MSNMKELSFKERYALMVAKSATLNWSPGGLMTLGNRPIEYISLTQMKANLAPIFPEFGLIFKASQYPEPMGSPSAPSGWKVKLDITIEDVYSDETMDFTFYGIGTGDKGLIIANSFALKTFLNTVLMVADGSEPITDDTMGPEKVPSVFTPKSPSETQASIEKIKNAAKAETAKANPPAKAVAKPAATPKAEAKAPAPKTEEKKPAEAPKVEEPKTTPPKAEPAPATQVEGEISDNRRAAVVKLLYDISAKHEAGEISDAEWADVEKMGKAVKDNASANMFIIKFRKLVR